MFTISFLTRPVNKINEDIILLTPIIKIKLIIIYFNFH